MSLFSSLGQADFERQVAHLPPPGRAWPRDPGTVMGAIWSAIGEAVWGAHQRAITLLEREANPGRAVELLGEWEADLGLPDPCTPLAATLSQRQAAVLAKVRSQGGQSIAYYISVAQAMGYTVTITEFHPFRLGFSVFGDALLGAAWQFAWQITVPTATVTRFRFGLSAFGEPFWTVDTAELECRIRSLAPAHTIVLFSYP